MLPYPGKRRPRLHRLRLSILLESAPAAGSPRSTALHMAHMPSCRETCQRPCHPAPQPWPRLPPTHCRLPALPSERITVPQTVRRQRAIRPRPPCRPSLQPAGSPGSATSRSSRPAGTTPRHLPVPFSESARRSRSTAALRRTARLPASHTRTRALSASGPCPLGSSKPVPGHELLHPYLLYSAVRRWRSGSTWLLSLPLQRQEY